MEDTAKVLGALLGDLDGDVIRVGSECAGQVVLSAWGEAFWTRVQNVPSPIECIALAAVVTKDLPLEPAANVRACQLVCVSGVFTGRG